MFLTLPRRRTQFEDFLGLRGAQPAVTQLDPVSFRLRSEVEKQSLVATFASLLNGLSASLQVVVQTVPFTPWRCGGTPKAMEELAAAQQRFLERLCREHRPMQRVVFVVHSRTAGPGLDTALERLTAHRVMRLTPDEALEEMADMLDQVTPGGSDVAARCCPGAVRERPLEVEVGDHLHRVSYVAGYPAQVELGWFAPLLRTPGEGLVSFHFHPLPTDQALALLERRRSELMSTLRVQGKRGREPDPQLEVAAHDAQRLQHELARSEQRLFRTGVYFGLRSKLLGELEESDRKLRAVASGSLVALRPARFQMTDGVRSMLPLGQDRLRRHHVLPTSAAASLFPFAASGLLDPEGSFLGIDSSDNSPVMVDRFGLGFENHNSVVLAKSGAGKSFFTKLDVLRSAARYVNVVVIDPEGEYADLAWAAGGSVIHGPTPSGSELDSHLTVFDLHEIEAGHRPAAMHKALEIAWDYAERPLRFGPLLLVLDEAWMLLGDRRFLGRVVEIAKTARKRAIGLACVSQDLTDLLRYPEAVSIVTNAAMQVLLRQSPQAIDGLVKAFGLTEGERSFLLSCAIGEGILVAGGHRVGFRAIASPEEERLLQTGLSGGGARLS